MDAALVCIAGIGLTFGMWWVYYIVPAGDMLHAHRERSFVWGYGHMVIFGAIVATGAGCMWQPISSSTRHISVRSRQC
jgi:low temperature requirement protein LtrA